MTKTITNIRSEFEALKPAIADGFAARVRKTFDRLVAQHGQKGLRALASSWSTDGGAYRQIRPFLKSVDGRMSGDSIINEPWLVKSAAIYAEDVVNAFASKLERKLADLTDVEVVNMNVQAFTFVIRGKLGKRRVKVDQSVTFNVSPKGTLFNQWPARIYVDGTFTSEAAFKKLPR